MRDVAPTRSPVHPPEHSAQVRLQRGLLTAWAVPSMPDTGMQQLGISISVISMQNFFPTANRGAGLLNSISTARGERSYCLTNGISAQPGPGTVYRRTQGNYPKNEKNSKRRKQEYGKGSGGAQRGNEKADVFPSQRANSVNWGRSILSHVKPSPPP